ncbi:MAG: FlgD immunoglobulin-like domain containing protein, partial [Candidatus Eisenbacteria bacterium]|nr:FlgD immunoglobulin-like domain containing protein [Candidatus Eisenbacteria bacterium]
RNDYGQCDVPAPNADFVAVAGGKHHSLGLKSDGTIVAWEYNSSGQCDVPLPNADFVALAGGDLHSLGLKSDGTIVAWGRNDHGQCDVPAPNADLAAVAAGYCQSLVVRLTDPGTSLEATVDFHPSTLNCGSHGRFVTCYIELPEGYDPADIDVSTVALNDELAALLHPTGVGDEDNDGIPDRMVKFDRADFVELLPPGEHVEAVVSGELNDETSFAGTGFVRVICKPGLREATAGTSAPSLRVSPGRDGSSATISYHAGIGGSVRLRVYDIGGRLIRTLVDGEASGNSCDVVWDGRADRGHRVGAGVYFVRLEAGGEVRTHKIAVVR